MVARGFLDGVLPEEGKATMHVVFATFVLSFVWKVSLLLDVPLKSSEIIEDAFSVIASFRLHLPFFLPDIISPLSKGYASNVPF